MPDDIVLKKLLELEETLKIHQEKFQHIVNYENWLIEKVDEIKKVFNELKYDKLTVNDMNNLYFELKETQSLIFENISDIVKIKDSINKKKWFHKIFKKML